MDIYRALKDIFGFTTFRTGQESCIQSIVKGVDTIAIMPTGGGKSICYQLPATLFKGLTLVVSPLISLMKDQTDSLSQLDISATFINSSLKRGEILERERGIKDGRYRIIYITPERASDPNFRLWINKLNISHIAIDEAHCISKWGHDFRPGYLNLIKFINSFPNRPVLSAFTATATNEVFKDITSLLQMRDPNIVRTGVERSNLSFTIVRECEKKGFINDFVKDYNNRAGIIYAATRKECIALHKYLDEHGHNPAIYHGGMSEQLRKQSQEEFIFDKKRVMVATNAFGMGIDKSNVRYVIHYSMPGDLESYYQEAGRAGRDSLLSDCILLYDPKDINIQKFFIRNSEASNDIKEIKYDKLEQMLEYCNTGMCLTKFINNYFDEESSGLCGHCSSCLENSSSLDVTVECQKVLSCLIRMGKRGEVHDISRVLKGIKSEDLIERELDKISTFGIMRYYTFSELENFYHFMKSRGMITIDDDQLSLGENYREILSGNVRVIRKKFKKRSMDSPLFAQLDEIRTKISEEEGVAPYFILSDFSLKEIEKIKPQTFDSFSNIEGVGKFKAQKYSDKFIRLFKKVEIQPKKIYSFHEDGFSKDIHFSKRQELLSMLKDGNTLENICNIYQLREKRAEKMIYRAVEEIDFNDWDSIIPIEMEDKAKEVLNKYGKSILKKRELDIECDIDPFHLHLFSIKFDKESG